MHVVIKVLDLLEPAVAASRVALAKSPMVILKNMLVRAELPSGISLMASDLDCSVVMRCEAAELVEPGAITLNAARFARVVGTFPKGATVTFETADDNSVTVRSARLRLKFETLPETDYPLQLKADGEDVREFEIDADQRRRLFTVPSVAVSTERSRYYLTGICLQARDGQLLATGTNGHVLIQTTIPLPSGAEGLDAIIPARGCAEVAKLGGPIRIDHKVIDAGDDRHRFCHKLIGATFPSWQRVIPAPSSHKVEVATAELLPVLDRLAAFGARQKSACAVGLEWTEGGDLSLCLSDRPGAADDFVSATCTADGFVALNVHYLEGLLNALGAERVVLDVKSPRSPLRIEVPEDPGALAIQMPMIWPGRP
jgi:DNA polymerase III subunit beta